MGSLNSRAQKNGIHPFDLGISTICCLGMKVTEITVELAPFLPKIKLGFCGVGSALCGINIPENIEGPSRSKKSHKIKDFLGYEPALKWSSEGLTFWRCQTRDSQKGDFLFLRTTTKTVFSWMRQFLGFVGIAGLGFMRTDIYHFKFWVVTDVLRLG